MEHLLDFIKYYIQFKQTDFFDKFEDSIQEIVKSRKSMGIREAILNYFEEKGFAEGEEE